MLQFTAFFMHTQNMSADPTIELAQQLIRIDSVTPNDSGCQDILCARLEKLGFQIERLHWEGVDNFWAELGSEGPTLCFAGHTDVVPPGETGTWQRSPFSAETDADYLHGRGAADMKGSLAAMITACEHFVSGRPDFAGRLAFLVTSDEEGMAINGTRRVMQWLSENEKSFDYCIIGEPSSSEKLGDMVKTGRRGSLNALLTIRGQQGHVAYPDKAKNPVHLAAGAIQELVAQQWDTGNEFFPATSFQISNIEAGTGATNVIPNELRLMFNFRYSTETTAEELQATVNLILHRYELDFEIDWHLSGEPFLTLPGKLTDVVVEALEKTMGYAPELSTTGGTSDGRFIAPYGPQVVELGPTNETIHKVDECVSISDLINLSKTYHEIMELMLPAK
jgi:succinyl-diaminopimelate desuccinylase